MIVRPQLEAYAEAHTTPEPPWLETIIADTQAKMGRKAGMLTGPLEGQLLKTLAWANGARRILEIGTFTGHSALAMAQALPPDGILIACEFDPEHAAIARANFDASPHGAQIDLRVGAALETLKEIDGPFDLVFIDADKPNYTNYFEAVVPLLSERGLIAVDNTLWSGQVLDASDTSDSTAAIRAFNEHVARDPRVECVVLTVGDGVTVIRKRAG